MCAALCVQVGTVRGVKCGLDRGALGVALPCAYRPSLVAMITPNDVLTNLRVQWPRAGRSASARVAHDDFVARHRELPLSTTEDLFDVVERLESRSPLTVLERAQVVRALLEDAADPEIHRALLQTLLPGVVSVCRQLRFGEGIVEEPRETVAESVSLLSELLVDWAGQSRPYAGPDLLSALRGRLRRWLLKEKAAQRRTTRFDQVDEPAEDTSLLLGRLESLRGGEHDRMARLTYARVFEGRSLRELATEDHSAPVSLRDELRLFAHRYLL